jgi:hypothetical protein
MEERAHGGSRATLEAEMEPEAATDALDSELVVAVFRTVVLLVAVLVPRLFGIASSYTTAEGLLAVFAGTYNIVVGFSCLYPKRYRLRRPFVVVVDMLLITLWMRISQQWELFSLYYIVVIVAAMWFRVTGGALAAIFCDFFFLLLWGRAAGDPGLSEPVYFSSRYALDLSLLLLVGCLVGYIAEAQDRERLRRLEGQLLVANYQREIDIANQLQPLLMGREWEKFVNGGAPEAGDSVTGASSPKMLWPGLKMGGDMKSARAFGGGDFFDIITLPENRIALCIADVSGKSVRAQARLPLLKYSLRALAPLYLNPDALITRLNQTLAPDLQTDLFIGLCFIILDPTHSELTWCNAGHIAPLLIKASAEDDSPGAGEIDRAVIPLETLGPPLGPFPEIPYSARTVRWGAGDRLLLFTDGLSDALSYGGTEDGEYQVRWTASALDNDVWRNPTEVAQRLVAMASSVLDEINTPHFLSSLRKPSPEGGLADRRDDITVVAVYFGAETDLAQDETEKKEA